MPSLVPYVSAVGSFSPFSFPNYVQQDYPLKPIHAAAVGHGAIPTQGLFEEYTGSGRQLYEGQSGFDVIPNDPPSYLGTYPPSSNYAPSDDVPNLDESLDVEEGGIRPEVGAANSQEGSVSVKGPEEVSQSPVNVSEPGSAPVASSSSSSTFPRPEPSKANAVRARSVSSSSSSGTPQYALTSSKGTAVTSRSVNPLSYAETRVNSPVVASSGQLPWPPDSPPGGGIPKFNFSFPKPVETNCYSKTESDKLFYKVKKADILRDFVVELKKNVTTVFDEQNVTISELNEKIEDQDKKIAVLYKKNQGQDEIIEEILEMLDSEEPSVTATIVSEPTRSEITTGEPLTARDETPKGPSVWAKTKRYVFGYEHAFDDVVTRKYFDSKGFLLPTTTVDDKVAIRMAAALAKFARTRKKDHLVPNIKGFTQDLSDRILNSLYPSADEETSWPFKDPEQKILIQKSFDVVTALASKVVIANKEKMNSERVATSLRSFLDALQKAENRFRKDSSEESPYRVNTRRSFPSPLFSGGGSKTRFRMKKNVHFKKSRKI
jgi:hypothetical protein